MSTPTWNRAAASLAQCIYMYYPGADDLRGAAGRRPGALRLDRRGRHLPDPPDRRRHPGHAGRPHRAARAGLRLEPGHDLVRGLGQPPALRPLRAVRRLADGALRGAPGDPPVPLRGDRRRWPSPP